MKTTSINEKKRAMGAEISAPDNRRIMIARVQAHVKRPKKFYFDDSNIPTENQELIGSCVGQAEGGEVECRELKDTGKVDPVSKRWLYGECKIVDGFAGEGTFPTVAASIKVNKGVPKKEFCPDNNSLSHFEYVKIPAFSEALKDDATLRVAEGYAFVPAVQEEILQALFQNGTYTATLQVGNWSSMPVKPLPAAGNHRIRLNGYREIDGDVMIWFRNSWGPKFTKVSNKIKLTAEEKKKVERGDGFFLFSEYEKFIFEQIVYTDIPYALIMEARNKKYIFLRDLAYKMTGTDVMELQKRLSKEMAKDGQPCFRYPTAVAQQFTTYFGRETEKAVQRYQEVYKIVKSSEAGYGRLGPKTRAALNLVAGIGAPLAAVARKIIINAGHDLSDPGAISGNFKEADETMKIRDEAVAQLRALGLEVVETPDNMTLAQCIEFANKQAPKLNDALLIDIHLNASSDKNARGVEGYYGETEQSKAIAAVFSAQVAKTLKFSDRGAKPDSATHVGELGWIRKTKAWATLVEVGFITNAADMATLRGSNGYKKAGEGIANAVMELFGISAPIPPEPTKPGLAEARKLIQEGLNILNLL